MKISVDDKRMRELATALKQDELVGIDLSGLDLRRCTFKGKVLRDVNLSGADLSGCDLSGIEFISVEMTNTKFLGTNLSKSRFKDVTGTGTQLDGADLRQSSFLHTELHGPVLFQARFDESNFHHTKFIGVANQVSDDSIRGDMELRGLYASFRETRHRDSYLEGYFLHSDFSGSTFTKLQIGGDFSNSSFDNSHLLVVHAEGTQLEYVSFRGARITGADFSESVLTGSLFLNGECDESSFDGCILWGITFDSMVSSSCNFLGARYNSEPYLGVPPTVLPAYYFAHMIDDSVPSSNTLSHGGTDIHMFNDEFKKIRSLRLRDSKEVKTLADALLILGINHITMNDDPVFGDFSRFSELVVDIDRGIQEAQFPIDMPLNTLLSEHALEQGVVITVIDALQSLDLFDEPIEKAEIFALVLSLLQGDTPHTLEGTESITQKILEGTISNEEICAEFRMALRNALQRTAMLQLDEAMTEMREGYKFVFQHAHQTYRTLSRQYHPDHTSDTNTFSLLASAWGVIFKLDLSSPASKGSRSIIEEAHRPVLALPARIDQ